MRRRAESGQIALPRDAQLRLPRNVSEAALRTALEAVAADLMVDIELA